MRDGLAPVSFATEAPPARRSGPQQSARTPSSYLRAPSLHRTICKTVGHHPRRPAHGTENHPPASRPRPHSVRKPAPRSCTRAPTQGRPDPGDPREGEAPSPARDGSPEVHHDAGARLRRLLAASLGSLEDPSSQWWLGSHLRRGALASAAAWECLRQAVPQVASGHSAWAPSSLPDRGHLSALTECCAAFRSPKTLVVRGPSPQGPCRSPLCRAHCPWAPKVRSNNQHHPEQSGTRACSPPSQGLSFGYRNHLEIPHCTTSAESQGHAVLGTWRQGQLRPEHDSGSAASEVRASVMVTYEATWHRIRSPFILLKLAHPLPHSRKVLRWCPILPLLLQFTNEHPTLVHQSLFTEMLLTLLRGHPPCLVNHDLNRFTFGD